MLKCSYVLFNEVIPAGSYRTIKEVAHLMTGFEKYTVNIKPSKVGSRAKFKPLERFMKLKGDFDLIVNDVMEEKKRQLTAHEMYDIADKYVQMRLGKCSKEARHAWAHIIMSDCTIDEISFVVEALTMTPEQLENLFSIGLSA